MILKRIVCILILGIVYDIFCTKDSLCGDYEQVTGLMDLRTTYSDGAHDLNSLIRLAETRGFDAIFINDHDRVAMEYGIFPFRNIFKKREELPSVNSRGAGEYLENIRMAAQQHPELIIVPGSETAPFYYWTGSPVRGNLTAHNWERHLLIIGLDNPQDYKNLPILHNGLSTRYLRRLMPVSIIFMVLILVGLVLSFIRGYYRVLGIVILVNATLMLIEHHPLKSSVFDQYSGDQGYLPYQELIDYVRDKGGMTFWTHPDAAAGANVQKGPITAKTPPHPESLLMTKGYTGFGALYGTWIKTTEPGREWDRALLEYCYGGRDTPAWGISAADYHKEGESGGRLGDFPTVFLVREKTREGVLSALRQGRVYACRTQGEDFRRFILDDFSVSGATSASRAVMGETIELRNKPEISIRISSSDKGNHTIDVRVIRSGEMIRTFSGTTPFVVNFEDDYVGPEEQTYYRMDIPGLLVSNPIFVKFKQD